MLKRSVLGVAITLHVLASSPNAAVLCQKRAGAVFIREACQKHEKLVDPSALGLKGDVGPKGDAGPSGAARAYGCSNVSIDGTLVTTCATRPNKNIVSVVAASQQANAICFVLDPSIDADSAVVLVSWNENSATTSSANVILTIEAGSSVLGCPANSVKVGTGRATSVTLVAVRLAVSIAVM